MSRLTARADWGSRAFAGERPAAQVISSRRSGVSHPRRVMNALVMAASHALLGFTAGVLLTIALHVIP